MTKTRRFSIIFSCPLKSSNANGRRASRTHARYPKFLLSYVESIIFHRLLRSPYFDDKLNNLFCDYEKPIGVFRAMHKNRTLTISSHFRKRSLFRRHFKASFRSILVQNSLCARRASSMEAASSHPRKRAYTPTTYRTTDSSRQNRLKLAKHIFGVIGINRIRFRSIIENTIPSSCLSNKIFPAE